MLPDYAGTVVHDASFARLRELSLTWSIPQTLTRQLHGSGPHIDNFESREVRELINGKNRGAPKKTGQAEQDRQTEENQRRPRRHRTAQPARHDEEQPACGGQIQQPEEEHRRELSVISSQFSVLALGFRN